MPISVVIRRDKSNESKCHGLEEQSINQEQNEDGLSAAFVETKVACDQRGTHSMLESHQLLARGNYKIFVLFGTKSVRILSLACLDTDAGPNPVREAFVLTACAFFT